jgi:hypothetical protein
MTNSDKKSPLSTDLKVACEICHFNIIGEDIWYSKLVDMLRGELSKATISKALDMLFDWGIIRVEYSDTPDGKGRKLLAVSNSSKPIVHSLYVKYWYPYRKEIYDVRENHDDADKVYKTFEEWAFKYYHGSGIPQCRCHTCSRIDCHMHPCYHGSNACPVPTPLENFEDERRECERPIIDKLRDGDITWDEAIEKIGSEERVEMLLEARREIHFYNHNNDEEK